MADWISAFIAALALAYSAYVDWKRKGLEGRVAEMNAKLLEHQIRTAEEEREARKRAAVAARLVPSGKSYRLLVSNGGPAAARNLDVSLLNHHVEASPIVLSDYNAKVPMKVLHPGQEFGLLWAVSNSTGSVFDISLRWTDGAGHQEKVVTVSV